MKFDRDYTDLRIEEMRQLVSDQRLRQQQEFNERVNNNSTLCAQRTDALRAEIQKLRDELKASQQQGEKELQELYSIISVYRKVLLEAGIVENCEAGRTEFQWVEQGLDMLQRNFHFKVNKVVKQK